LVGYPLIREINMKMPEPGLTLEVKYVKNHDGDTITFEVSRSFDVRLLGIDTDELDEERGPMIQKFVQDELSNAKTITVFIPAHDSTKFMDFNSFGRVLGDVYYDGKSLREELDKRGYFKAQETVRKTIGKK
jgi:endonuclease YncB( thermonuclease family)